MQSNQNKQRKQNKQNKNHILIGTAGLSDQLDTKSRIACIIRAPPGSDTQSLVAEIVKIVMDKDPDWEVNCVSASDHLTDAVGKHGFNGKQLTKAHQAAVQAAVDTMKNKSAEVLIIDNPHASKWEATPYVKAACKHNYFVSFRTPKDAKATALKSVMPQTVIDAYFRRCKEDSKTGPWTLKNVLAAKRPAHLSVAKSPKAKANAKSKQTAVQSKGKAKAKPNKDTVCPYGKACKFGAKKCGWYHPKQPQVKPKKAPVYANANAKAKAKAKSNANAKAKSNANAKSKPNKNIACPYGTACHYGGKTCKWFHPASDEEWCKYSPCGLYKTNDCPKLHTRQPIGQF